MLKPADVQALAPNATAGGVVAENDRGAGCVYTWGPRTKEWGQATLTVAVINVSEIWPGGLSPADIKLRVTAEASGGGPDASQIPGIGDGAVFTTEPRSNNAAVKAYFVKTRGVVLVLTFHGGNAAAQKDK